MTHQQHVDLMKQAVPEDAGIWADLGSGEGAFTLALADLLPSGSKIYSIDKDRASLEVQASLFNHKFPNFEIEFISTNFTSPLPLSPSRFSVTEWGGMVKNDPNHPFTCSQ